MTGIRSYRDLIVWQKSMKLVSEIYICSKEFPSDERFGLTSQMRRSAVSIPSNIAEGYGRNSTGDYKRFLQIAVGSLFELQTQIEIAFQLNYVNEDKYKSVFMICTEIDKMLYSLIQKVK
jgi:four helix bundle protein